MASIKVNGEKMVEYSNDVLTDSHIMPFHWECDIKKIDGFIYELERLFKKHNVKRKKEDIPF